MVDFDDFFDDLENEKNLKALLQFNNSTFNYEGKEITMNVKLKKKLHVDVYIKPNKDTNQLF